MSLNEGSQWNVTDGDISSWNRRALGGRRTHRCGRRSTAQPPRNRARRSTTSSPSKQEAIKTAICLHTRKHSAGRGRRGMGGGGRVGAVCGEAALFVCQQEEIGFGVSGRSQ